VREERVGLFFEQGDLSAAWKRKRREKQKWLSKDRQHSCGWMASAGLAADDLALGASFSNET